MVSESGELRIKYSFLRKVACVPTKFRLARLIGYYIVPNQSRYLVYNFVPNGYPKCWIFPPKNGGNENPNPRCLRFDLRYRVAIEVVKALNYLHSDCRSRILHPDVKPENILLYENHHAIISAFGL
ncbi:unnamed protein product [Linum tenue]|uniref:Protein kinase domain-containing protein n=1 Tax=Linum tenue TaxID=586396 RepID=A0AAV0S0J8_9ROSI|nr:unnamed protein product [Linum tenue]